MSHLRRDIAYRRLHASAAFITIVVLTGTSAMAANRQAQERAARKACLSGDYTKGVDILSDLFVELMDPNYVFNQARCFEQNRRYEDAIARFREYLRVAQGKLDAAGKAATEQHINECQEMLAQERGTSPPATSAQPSSQPLSAISTPPTETAPTPQPAPLTVFQAEPQPQLSSDGSGLRIGGAVLASVGVAGVAAGVLLNLKANAIITDMEAHKDGYSSGENSDHKTYETAAWVSYGAGAVCVVTGAILYGVGLKAKSRSSSNVAILPAVGLGQTGATIVGAF